MNGNLSRCSHSGERRKDAPLGAPRRRLHPTLSPHESRAPASSFSRRFR
ncbi:hypothetical protein DVS28_a2233 [Euzebya pacifica]|uniref:Uncharacterized protein n=1 Tax=Euzebya pacifica TaxID=1608957 RepID=A0A346XXG8_9ACTN|nr:hypothetical protein DVS28_a2233 [Euzebya pacifica]